MRTVLMFLVGVAAGAIATSRSHVRTTAYTTTVNTSPDGEGVVLSEQALADINRALSEAALFDYRLMAQ